MMGDALTRLAQKSLGTVQVVRPILRPVFGGTLEPAPLIVGSPEVEPGTTDSATRPLPAQRARKHAMRGSPGISAPSHGVEATPEGAAAPSTFLPDADEGDRAGVFEQPFHEGLSARALRRTPETEPSPIAIAEPSSVTPLAGVAAETRLESTPAAFEAREPRHSVNAAEPLERRSADNNAQAYRDAYSADAIGDENTFDVVPVVQVTIGRVDVRAVSPPAPPTPMPSGPPRRPRLTLEAYLRGENRT
jgi:hypothetical protein